MHAMPDTTVDPGASRPFLNTISSVLRLFNKHVLVCYSKWGTGLPNELQCFLQGRERERGILCRRKAEMVLELFLSFLGHTYSTVGMDIHSLPTSAVTDDEGEVLMTDPVTLVLRTLRVQTVNSKEQNTEENRTVQLRGKNHILAQLIQKISAHSAMELCNKAEQPHSTMSHKWQ